MTHDDELIERLRNTLETEASAITPTHQVPAVTGSSSLLPPPRPGPEPGPVYINGHPRRSWPRWPLALVAAAVVAAGVTLAALNWPSGHSSRIGVVSPPASTAPAGGKPAHAPVPTTVPAQAVTPAPTVPTPASSAPQTSLPTPVPAGFSPEAVTFVSSSQGWAAGWVPCSSGTCVGVVQTVDAGQTWVALSAPSISNASNDGGANLSIRFADPSDGWIYTSSPAQLWSTHDGGTTWQQVPLPIDAAQSTITALETSGGRVYAAVISPSASPSIQVESSPVGSDSWSTSDTGVSIGAGPGPGTQLVLQGSSGWLVEDDRTVVGGSTLSSSGSWQSWTPPCAQANGSVALAAANPSDLVAVCEEGEWGPAANLPAGSTTPSQWLFASTNGGASFQAVGALHPTSVGILPQVAIPSSSTIVVGETLASMTTSPAGGAVSAASASGPSVNLASGSATAAGASAAALSASFDGGHTWQTVYAATPGATWAYLGFTSLTQGVAIESTGQGSQLLMTRDGGHAWAPVLG